MQVHIELDSVSRQELEHIVHHHPKAYLRERAAAILKIAQGQSGCPLPTLVYYNIGVKTRFISGYIGIKSRVYQDFTLSKDEEESPLFPTLTESEAELKTSLIVHQSPLVHDISRSRWTLQLLLKVCSYLRVRSSSDLWNWLKKWKLAYKRGRLYVHSPDVNYQAKLDYIRQQIETPCPQARAILCLDELTIYSKPSLAQAYAKGQALAQQGWLYTQSIRVLAAINILTGKISYVMQNKISPATLIRFYQQIAQEYPQHNISIIQDNWTVHYHPDVLAALQQQDFPFGYTLPASWKNVVPKKKWIGLNVPIQLLSLPTYASWLNPIEKVWKKLKQELIHLHPFKDQWYDLKQAIKEWLDNYTSSLIHEKLRNYIGLNSPTNFLGQIVTQMNPIFKERFFYESQ